MTTARHAVLGVFFALAGAGAVYCFIFYAWLTAYYTRSDLIHQAKIRANVWFVVLLVCAVALVADAVIWWRSRRKVG